MQIKEIVQLLKQGEGETIEFKLGVSDIAHDICAFLNTQGGCILIGINDQGGIIGASAKIKQKISNILAGITPHPKVNIESKNIEGNEVVSVKVEKSDKLHSVGNRAYIRIGSNNRPLSMQEVVEKAAESLTVFFDELSCNEAKLKDIDQNKIKNYLQAREKIRGVKMSGSLQENIKLLKIINKKSQPTNAGILFFAKNPQEFIHYAKVKLVEFTNEEMDRYKDSKEFSGTLPEIIDQIEKYWAKNLSNIGGALIGFKRQDFFEYPLPALREALINALIHRNYFDVSEIRVFIFPNKILIKNPGAFPPGVTPDNPEHKARNPILAQFMYDLGYIEKYGRGILKIKKECKMHPLTNVYFHLKPFMTELEFCKDKNIQIDQLSEKIIQFLKLGSKRSSDIAKFTGLSKQTVLNRLDHLFSLGIILKTGKGPQRKYYFK